MFDVDNGTSLFWRTIPLFEQGHAYDAIEVYTRIWNVCQELRLDEMEAVLIEQQMARDKRLTTVEAAFAMTCFHNALILPPATIKSNLGIATRDYRKNKLAAAEFCRENVVPELDENGVERFVQMCDNRNDERFDMADAANQIYYYMHNLRACRDTTRYRLDRFTHPTAQTT